MSDWYPGLYARQDEYGEPLPPVQSMVTPKQPLPPEFTVPPLPERQNMFERALPPAYDPLSRTQQAVGGAAFGLTGMGALADLYEARTPGEALFAGAAVTPVGKIAGKGAKAAAKLGDLAATERGVVGFAPGEMFADPKLKAKAESLRGTFSQYAEQYPPTAPGVPMLDKKTGKPFMTKGSSPDAEAFAAARSTIQKDMDVHGYQPFFDPSKRFHVDPSKYPAAIDTAKHLPVKMETIQKWTNELDTPETRAALQRMYKVGQTVEGAENWYMMGQLEKEYVKELGAKAGREKFRADFGGAMAATTGGADPTANFLMAHYANFMRNRGEDFPRVSAAENRQVKKFAEGQGVPYVDKKGRPIDKTGDIASYALPFPIGGQYAAGNLDQYKRVFDEVAAGKDVGKALEDANPKRLDFMQSFTGNPNSFVWDKQMTTGATAGKYDMPPSYGVMETMARDEAAKASVPAQNFQDVGWAGQKAMLEGAKPLTGGFQGPSGIHNYQYEGPMINHINASIERTHRLTGMPREEIVRRGLVLGEIPMYGLGAITLGGGAAAMGGIADESRYQQ